MTPQTAVSVPAGSARIDGVRVDPLNRTTASSIRVVATDLDGTLLRSDRSLSRRSVDALAACTDAGIEVVFVTARPPRVVTELLRTAAVVRTALCGNGTVTYDFATGGLEFTRFFDVAAARSLVGALRRALPDAATAVETGESIWMSPDYRISGIADGARFVADPWDSVWDKVDRVIKVLARSPRDEHGEPVMSADEMLAAATAAGLHEIGEVSHSGGLGLLEIAPPHATKAEALQTYCAAQGVTPDRVLAFGDMVNDLPMLTWAGSAYAVANAHPLVLAAVDRHTASHDQDGVALALESLLAARAGAGTD